MSDLILQDSGALTISESDRIRIAAAWEALSVNSRRSYQGAWDRCGQWLADRGISLDDLSDELMAVYIATLVEMQVDGRWKDSRMPSHYASAEIAKNSATARIKYGKRR